MKHTITCDPEHLEAATKLLLSQLAELEKYSRVGWGWTYGDWQAGPKFFVRRLTNGLSVIQTLPAPRP